MVNGRQKARTLQKKDKRTAASAAKKAALNLSQPDSSRGIHGSSSNAKKRRTGHHSHAEQPENPTQQPPKPKPAYRLKLVGPKEPPVQTTDTKLLCAPSLDSVHSDITPPPSVSQEELVSARHAATALLDISRFSHGTHLQSRSDADEYSHASSPCARHASETLSQATDLIDLDPDSEDDDDDEGGNGEHGESETETEDSEEEEPESVFTIEYLVPFDGASEYISLPSDTTWKQFKYAIADTMRIPRKQADTLRLAYRFSTAPQKAPFSHLRKPDHLVSLTSEASEAMESLAKSRKKSKKFHVEVKDLGEAERKKEASAVGKGKKGQAKQKWKKADSDSDNDDIDDITGEGPANGDGIRKKRKSQAQYIADITRDLACPDHAGRPCVKMNDECVAVLKEQLGLWALLMMRGWPSTTIPPNSLKLSDALKKPAKKDNAPAQPPATPTTVNPFTPITATTTMNPVPGTFQYAYHSAPGYYLPPYHVPYPGPMPFISPPPHSRRSGYSDIPSSDPPDEWEDTSIFPFLSDWLRNLDLSHSRGNDGHNFGHLIGAFEQAKYHRVVDIISLSIGDITIICPDIAPGTATKVLDYAQQDVEALRQKEKRHRQKERERERRDWSDSRYQPYY